MSNITTWMPIHRLLRAIHPRFRYVRNFLPLSKILSRHSDRFCTRGKSQSYRVYIINLSNVRGLANSPRSPQGRLSCAYRTTRFVAADTLNCRINQATSGYSEFLWLPNIFVNFPYPYREWSCSRKWKMEGTSRIQPSKQAGWECRSFH